jgi:ammonium transporter, Amt family
LLTRLVSIVKFLVKIDDSLDVFAEHGVGGMVGLLFNAFFGSSTIIGLDGVNMGFIGGFLDSNWRQLYVQIAYIVACTAYAFVMSAIIAKLIDFVPGLKLRASEEAELLGMDDDQHGEFSYDYVEVRRDFLAWSPHQQEQTSDGVKITPQHGIEEHANLANGTSSPVEVDAAEKTEKTA